MLKKYNGESNVSGALKEFQENLLKLTDLENTLRGAIQMWESSNMKNNYEKQLYNSWELQNQVIVNVMRNQFDLSSKLILESGSFAEKDYASLEPTDPSFFYIFRNAIFETTTALNETITVLTEMDELQTDEMLRIIQYLGLGVLGVLFACFCLVILPIVKGVESLNRTVWKLFFLIPLEVLSELKGKNEDRLETFHRKELTRTRPERTSFSEMSTRLELQPLRKYPKILLRISFYYIFTLGFIVFYYYQVVAPLQTVLRATYSIHNWSSQRIFAANCAYFWLEQSQYKATGLDYYTLVPEYQTVPGATEEIQQQLTRLSHFHRRLLYGEHIAIGMSTEHYSVLFDTECKDCTLTARGVHSGLISYLHDIELHVSLGQTASLESLRDNRDRILSALTLSKSLYSAEISSTLATISLTAQILSLFYALSAAALFLGYYIPSLNAVRSEIEGIWGLSLLIPGEYKRKLLLMVKEKCL